MKFEELNISKEVKQGLADAGFTEMFPIQEKTITALLENKDVIGKAQSGSGKTLAFLVPIVERVKQDEGLQALIMAPTRELAIQIDDVLRKISKHKRVKSALVYGGKSVGEQAHQLHGANIVVATPGRLRDHMERKNIDLKNVKFVILDESDRMLDMGFIYDIDFILRHTNKTRQTLLFSATMPDPIRNLVHRYMKSPVTIELHKETPTVMAIEQEAYLVLDNDKHGCLKFVLEKERPSLCIIFVRTKREARRLANVFGRDYNIAAIHGDLSQNQRERVLGAFRSKRLQCLIATDVAARGLDIPAVSHVINYDLPNDVETFIHRVGRTARAGAKGKAIMIAVPAQMNDLKIIEHAAKVKMKINSYRGKLSEEQAALMTEKIKSGGSIIPRWAHRSGKPNSFFKKNRKHFRRR